MTCFGTKTLKKWNKNWQSWNKSKNHDLFWNKNFEEMETDFSAQGKKCWHKKSRW
jgi:hypothetical protein